MYQLAGYFVILAMIFTYQEQEVNARPAPDPCFFRRNRRPASTEALRGIEETTVVDGRKEKMMQIETLLKELWYLESSPTTESSNPEVLNNVNPRPTSANNYADRYFKFLGMLFK